MGKSPFTMPGSEHLGRGNQSVTPGKYTSPAKRADVIINDENVGTGDEAYALGRMAEAKKSQAWAKGTAGTEKERQSEKEKEVLETRQTKISYTGDDAHKRINDSDLSSAEKRDEHAKVRGGGSYDS